MKKEVKQTGEKKPGFSKKSADFSPASELISKKFLLKPKSSAGPAKKNLSDIPLLLSALLH